MIFFVPSPKIVPGTFHFLLPDDMRVAQSTDLGLTDLGLNRTTLNLK